MGVRHVTVEYSKFRIVRKQSIVQIHLLLIQYAAEWIMGLGIPTAPL